MGFKNKVMIAQAKISRGLCVILLLVSSAALGAPKDSNELLRRLLAPQMTSERQQQLNVLFPKATFRPERVPLSDEQLRAVRAMTDAQVVTKAIDVYEVRRGGKLIAFVSFFDVSDHSGALCKVAVAVLPDSRILKVAPFPSSSSDPMSDKRFLSQFSSKRPREGNDWQESLSIWFPAGEERALVPFVRGVRTLAALIVASKSLGLTTTVLKPLRGQP